MKSKPHIDDTTIKQCIQQYQQDESSFSQCGEQLSTLIYNYPKIKYGCNSDHAADYYLYVYKRLPAILKKFTVEDAQFFTWFYIVLHRQYLNFKNSLKIQQQKQPQTVSLSELDSKEEEEVLGINNWSAEEYTTALLGRHSKWIPVDVNQAIAELPDKLELVFRIHNFSFFNPDSLWIAKEFFNLKVGYLIKKIPVLAEEAAQTKEKNDAIYEQLCSYFDRMIGVQEKLRSLTFKKKGKLEEDSRVVSLQNQQKKWKNQVFACLIRYRRSQATVSFETVADFLKISPEKVSHYIYRGRELIKQRLGADIYE